MLFCPVWPGTENCPISASLVAGIIGVSHQAQVFCQNEYLFYKSKQKINELTTT
jgi:hypothetical protein